MDGGAWWAAVHGVAKSWTWLSDFTFTLHFHALEKEMATHSCVLAWRIPGTGEPGGLPSVGSHRVGHDWSDLAAVAAASFKVAGLDLIPTLLDNKTQGIGHYTKLPLKGSKTHQPVQTACQHVLRWHEGFLEQLVYRTEPHTPSLLCLRYWDMHILK